MYYLIPIPFVVLAVIIKLVAKQFDLKIFNIISNIVIIVGVMLFIYFYLDYNGINLLEKIKTFLKI